jgi:hypothetical protein
MVSMPHLELVEPQVVPTNVQQWSIYQHTTWPTKPVCGQGQRLHVLQNTHILR